VLDEAICLQPIGEVAELIKRGEVGVVELTELVLDRVARLDKKLNSYITVCADKARSDARRLDALLRHGTYLGPLHGIPVGLKDNIPTSGVQTTAGTPILRGWIPQTDATAWRRLETNGAVLVGKNNLWEFAFGGPHPEYGQVSNPWDLRRNCAGTSSGSASAVASGLAFASLGTDTGGSVRVPAAFCGIVGLKPTFGRISRAGVIPVSYSMDHVCPMTRSVYDCALVLSAIAGYDPADRTTAGKPEPAQYLDLLDTGVSDLRLGFAIPTSQQAFDKESIDALRRACDLLTSEGASLSQVALPQADSAAKVIMDSEAADYHRDHLRSRAADFADLTRTRLETAEFIPATDYVRAQRVRQRAIVELDEVFREVDALILPANLWVTPAYLPSRQPDPPADVDTALVGVPGGRAGGPHIALFNLTGNPAAVVPVGSTGDDLPLAIQVVARHFDEATLFRVARSVERNVGWQQKANAVLSRL
jgi:aspartyl-tRNA(Asn)/glutamyl-tRNA(Gln) amidotransferase subunit A